MCPAEELPKVLRRAINRAAHAAAQASFRAHRNKLEAQAVALFKAGRSSADILADLRWLNEALRNADDGAAGGAL